VSVRRFTSQLFDAIAVHIHGRVRASGKRDFSGQINVGVPFCGGSETDGSRVRVDKKTAATIVDDLGDLRVGRPLAQS
jgi:hypothetical protein